MDSTSTSGGAKTGLTSASSGLIISTIADNEATATAYTVAGGTIESITTLGTFAAPTATKCRFKEVDATNHPGLYEIQIADARWAVSNARSVIISVSGATGAAQVDAEVQLEPVPANARQWLDGTIPAVNTTGVPKVDLVLWLGVAPLALSSQQVQGVVPNTQKVDIDTIKTNPVVNAGTVTFPAGATLASTTNITAGTMTTTTNLTNLPSIPANWLTAAGIAAGALNGKGDWLLSSGYTAPLDAAGVRSAVGLATASLDAQLAAIAGYIDTEVGAIKAKTDNLPSDPADASDIAASFATVNSTLSTIASYIDTEVAAIKAKTDLIPASPAAVGDAMTLTSAYDFAKGTVAMVESYASDGAALTPVQAHYMAVQGIIDFSVSGTTLTIKKRDGTTTALTCTLNDGTNPTSRTQS